MSQFITTLKRTTLSYVMDSPTSFTFRDDKPYRWLQRVCFGVLARIGAFEQLYETKHTYGPLDSHKLKEAIFEAVQNHRGGWKHFDTSTLGIVIGSKQYRELVQDKEMIEAFGWRLTLDIHTPWSTELVGLPVAVVPWIDGFAILPRLDYMRTHKWPSHPASSPCSRPKRPMTVPR